MGKDKGKNKQSGKEERRARKAEGNRSREKSKRRGGALDRSQLATFSGMLRANGFMLREVDRDGNCFFRSLADQLEGQQHNYDEYRQQVIAHMEANADNYTPFLTFGEGDEEDDKDFEEARRRRPPRSACVSTAPRCRGRTHTLIAPSLVAHSQISLFRLRALRTQYTARMRRDGEWAGQPELLAAVHALAVDIVVHQFELPSYRITCEAQGARCIHVSYHDGAKRAPRRRHAAAAPEPASQTLRGPPQTLRGPPQTLCTPLDALASPLRSRRALLFRPRRQDERHPRKHPPTLLSALLRVLNVAHFTLPRPRPHTRAGEHYNSVHPVEGKSAAAAKPDAARAAKSNPPTEATEAETRVMDGTGCSDLQVRARHTREAERATHRSGRAAAAAAISRAPG
eukprot:2931529-Prymnesium_polylepis.1